MTKKEEAQEILTPSNQLNLYGFTEYFKYFVDLYNKKSLPNVILLTLVPSLLIT